MEAAAEETHRASRRQVPQLPVPSVLGKVPTAPALRSQHHEARAELSLALGWDTAGPSQVAPARGGSAPAQPAALSLPPSTPSPNTAEPKLGKMTRVPAPPSPCPPAAPPPSCCPQPQPRPFPARTGGTRARPRSGGRPWGGSRPGRCCGSGRRSGAGGGARRASWPGGPSWRGSSPRRHSTACAAAGPRCTPSPAPAAHAAAGRRRLGSRRWLRDGWTHRCAAQAGLSQPAERVPPPSISQHRLTPQPPPPVEPLAHSFCLCSPWPHGPVPAVPTSAHSQSR